MPPLVCSRCGQTYHDEEPRWDCACGPDRPDALTWARPVVSDDPMTWYDNFNCYPTDPPSADLLVRAPLPRRPSP